MWTGWGQYCAYHGGDGHFLPSAAHGSGVTVTTLSGDGFQIFGHAKHRYTDRRATPECPVPLKSGVGLRIHISDKFPLMLMPPVRGPSLGPLGYAWVPQPLPKHLQYQDDSDGQRGGQVMV